MTLLRDVYLTAMSLPDTCGDELCLHSLVDAFAIKITVFTPQYGTLLFNESESTTIMIAYNGRDHYDVTLHRANSNSISSPLPCESPFDDPPMEPEVYNDQPLKRSDTITLLSINAAILNPCCPLELMSLQFKKLVYLKLELFNRIKFSLLGIHLGPPYGANHWLLPKTSLKCLQNVQLAKLHMVGLASFPRK